MKTKTKRIIIGIFLACGIAMSACTQSINVNGLVTDASNGKALSGVAVAVKGTKQTTSTNSNGEYSISTETGKTLVFTYAGYTKQEIVVKNTRHNVQLAVNTAFKDIKTKPDVNAPEPPKPPVIEYEVSEVMMVMDECKSVSADYSSGYHRTEVHKSMAPPPVVYDYNHAGTEEYSNSAENRFKNVMQEALSTFSLDVDAASYSNIRRIIGQGQLPSKDAVRVEEMINYFSYDYKQPTGEHPVNIVTETSVCPWNPKHGLVRIGVKAKEISSDNLPASNFVFLIDVSGSMYGATRLELVKSSLKLLSNNLRSKDRVAIVVYAGAAGEVLSSTEGTDKQKIIEAIEKLTAGGSTAGGAGIQLAYKIAEKNFVKDGNNRIILCTDGDFNVGVSSNNELEKLIEEKRKTGVYLTVLGYGMGNYKDSKLQTLAQKGNGNHAYIDNIQEANKVLVNEFGSTMYAVANDVKIQVEFNPKYVNSYRLVGYETRMLNKEDFNDDTKDAGELGAGHTVTAIYEIIPAGVDNMFGGVDKLKYQQEPELPIGKSSNNSLEMLTVKLRYKKSVGSSSIKMEHPVMAGKFGNNPSADFKFAMSVAMFGQLLRDSDFKGEGTYDKVISLAREGLGEDVHGYRREFVRLAEAVNQLKK